MALLALLSSGSLIAQSRVVAKGTTRASSAGFGVGLSVPTFVGVDLVRPDDTAGDVVLSVAGNEEGTAPYVTRIASAADAADVERVFLSTPFSAASAWARVRDPRSASGAKTGKVVYEVGYF
jgi:hypothetical protein